MKHRHNLAIAYRDLDAIRANSRNARTHTRRQIEQIASSIQAFGFTNPILVDEHQTLIAGHGRLAAAKSLGLDAAPTIQIDGLSDAEKRALMLADNKIALNAGWDAELLKLELEHLEISETDFDIRITGFATAEIDAIIDGLDADSADHEDEVLPVDRSSPPISRLGDVWQIGRHKLICGSALEVHTYRALLGDEKAQLIFTDPPYNVPIAGHVSRHGKIKHKEFLMASGEMGRDAFTAFLSTAFRHLNDFSSNGSIHYICMDWRHMQEMQAAANQNYTELKNLCVWAKTNGGMGSLYRSQHELIFVYKNGNKPHINNVELGRFGRNRSNLWTYPGVNAFGKDRDGDLAMHPTVKPIALIVDAIRDCSNRDGIILDAFAGSGTTLLAAERTNRRGFGIELDPYYVDTTIYRFIDLHNLDAIHIETGQSFAARGSLVA